MLVNLDSIDTACVDAQLLGIRLWCAMELAEEDEDEDEGDNNNSSSRYAILRIMTT